MGAFSRNKGKAGEREVARAIHDATGWEVKRRVRQIQGDSDIDVEGTPLAHWTLEVKRYAKATRSDIAAWWAQAVDEAKRRGDTRPVLLYRLDRDEWRAVWMPHGLSHHNPNSYSWTHESSLIAWLDGVRGKDLI